MSVEQDTVMAFPESSSTPKNRRLSSSLPLSPLLPPPALRSPLDEEIAEDELRFEEYGGDDVRDPPAMLAKEIQRRSSQSGLGTHSPPSATSTVVNDDPGARILTWDSPTDPGNPQNWTPRYKWLIIMLCSLMTVNVSVSIHLPHKNSLLTSFFLPAHSHQVPPPPPPRRSSPHSASPPKSPT